MDNSSSSDSAMDDASMDESEHEPEYAFELDDHDAHDDYEDVPDDDDDDDDMDEDDDHHIDLTAPTTALPDLINDLRVFRSSSRSAGSYASALVAMNRLEPQVVNLPRFNISESLFSDLLRESVGHISEALHINSHAALRHIGVPLDPVMIHSRRQSSVSRDASALHPLLHRPRVRSSPTHRISGISRSSFASLDRHLSQRAQPASAALSSLSSLQELAISIQQPSATEPEENPIQRHNLRPHTVLEQADLMRSINNLRLSQNPPLQLVPHRSRLFGGRSTPRERAEKVSSGLAKRWNYEPYCSGGDSLPAFLDHCISHRRSSRSAVSSSMPMIAQQTHESIDQVSEGVTEQLTRLLHEMYKIEDDVDKREKEIAAKKREAKRKKAEEEAKAAAEAAAVAVAAAAANDVGQQPSDSAPSSSQRDSVAPQQQRQESGSEQRMPSSNYSAIAVRQAAAAGISLEAPASENPEVVAAATQSTGIDPAFLAALPDDMRTEILTQYFEQIRTQPASGASGQNSSQGATTVNQDFLVALPPALRAEVLELDAEFQSRQQRSGSNAAPGTGNNGNNSSNGAMAASDMDNATFLATLAPELREEILLESGEGFLRTLPPNLLSEARMLRERDASSRLPWRVSRNEMPGFPLEGRRMRELPFSQRTERNRQREAPIFRWKKVSSGWLREVPRVEDEPKATLKKDGLSSLVTLLWTKQEQLGKSMLYQVFAHSCKSTESRRVVLDELMKLITSNVDTAGGKSGLTIAPSSIPMLEVDRKRQHGTAVRKGLELLTMLCKSDAVVAETLLGLPRSEEELKHSCRVTLSEDAEIIESEANPVSLSTLASLFVDPLFERSNSHLEQLVCLVSTISQAIPAETLNGTQKSGLRSSTHNRSGISSSARDPLGLFVVDGDNEPPAMFSVPTEERVANDDDESDFEGHIIDPTDYDSSEEVWEYVDGMLQRTDGMVESAIRASHGNHARQQHSRRQRSRQAANGQDKKDSDEKVDSFVPCRYRIPALKENELVALSRVLLRSGCSDRMYERASKTIGLLGELPSNRNVFMSSLSSMAASGGKEIQQEYQKCVSTLLGVSQSQDMDRLARKRKRLEVVNSFSIGSASNELTLLRVVKSMSTLLNHEYAEWRKRTSNEENVTTKESQASASGDRDSPSVSSTPRSSWSQSRYQMTMMRGLQDLWDTLDRLLALVSDETKLKGKNEPGSVQGRFLSSARSAAEVLKSDRRKGSSRNLSPVLARLSPMIEAFLVTHSIEQDTDSSSRPQPSSSSSSPSSPMAMNLNTTVPSDMQGVDEIGTSGTNSNINNNNNNHNHNNNSKPGNSNNNISSSGTVGWMAPDSPMNAPLSPLPGSKLRGNNNKNTDNGKGEDISSEDVARWSVQSLDNQLAVFVERHRGPINNILRANPSLLETSFKGALRHPHAIDFDNKKAYFRSVLRRRSSEAHAGTIRIKVRRDRVFDDSYYQLRKRKAEEMKGRLHVQFNGEEGVDAGGVTREWYVILARQIFDPNYVLFTRSAAKAATYQPDKRSYINSEHLETFRFVGRIIGKAIYDGQLIDAYFTRSFYKHILGLKPNFHDIEAEDPEYYKSLKWMLENDCTGIIDYTMSAEYDQFGKQTIIDLVPNGRNIAVTEENKADYVRLVTDVRMTKTIEKQIEAFKEGFYELIPHEDCRIFNELELELLMSGLPDIDMGDLKANVEYSGYTASSAPVVWFWRCVSKMDQEDLARLVMFVTGTSKVPLEGFSQLQGMNGTQKFQIHRVGGDTTRLPSAHTCFNQLDLPEYSTAEVLSERLLRAIRECSVGFGFA